MTYISDLPTIIAQALATSMVQHAPDETRRQFIFGAEVGCRDDEDIVITYERRQKKPTLVLLMADDPAVAAV